MSDKEIQSDKKMISENDLLSETKAEMDTISKQILELQEKSELTKSEKRRLSRLQKKVESLEAQQEEEKEYYPILLLIPFQKFLKLNFQFCHLPPFHFPQFLLLYSSTVIVVSD